MKVVAVEPVEQVFKLLEANVAANDLHNVQVGAPWTM